MSDPNSTDLFDEIAVLRQVLDAQNRLLALRRANGLAFYTPHRKQEMFHRAGDMDFRYVRTGNRFGKSEMGAAEDCSFALGERPWFDKGDIDRTKGIPKHPTKGLIITTDWDKSREVFTEHEGGELGKLFRYLPAGCVKKVFKNSARAVERIVISRPQELGGGESVICVDTVASWKQNSMSQESSAWDWIHVDEPIPEGQWIGCSRGLVDRDGKGWFTCTPLDQPWINRKFLPTNRTVIKQGEAFSQDLEFEGEHVKTWMVTGSMDDNPHNSKAAIAKFMLDLERTPEQTACRRNGTPLAMSGLVIPEFSIADHVYTKNPRGWDAPDVPPRNYTIRIAIDPHPKKPIAVLFLATSPQGYTYAYHEIFKAVLVSDICEEILARTKGYYVQDCLIDPIAKTNDPVDNSCMMDEFLAKGVWCVCATKAKEEGILKVRERFRERVSSHPTLFVGSHMTRFLYEIDNWVYDPTTDKPIKKDDDIMENLYRLALTELDYVSPDGTTIRKPRETDPEEYLSTVLRNDLQRDSDFGEQELDTEEDPDVVTTRQKTPFEQRVALNRKTARKAHHDSY